VLFHVVRTAQRRATPPLGFPWSPPSLGFAMVVVFWIDLLLRHGRMPLCACRARSWPDAAACQAVAGRGCPLAAVRCCCVPVEGHGQLLHICLQGWPCRCGMLLHMYKL
jgi:hypothetical protein